MKDNITLKSNVEIKIISNPLRMKILKNYYSIGKPTTVKQMAKYMGEVPANIHYHVKKLIEINVLALHHTENVNGITAKFYLPVAKTITIDDPSNTIEDGYINEKEVVVSTLFDDMKVEFLSKMRLLSDIKDQGTLVNKMLFLTRDEYLEVLQYITDLTEGKKEKRDLEQKPYMFFSGLIES